MIEYTVGRHHGEATANTTVHIFTARRRCIIDRVEYANTVGLVEHADDHVTGTVQNGEDVLATLFATDSDLEGADNSLGTDPIIATPPAATRLLAAGDVLDLVLTAAGSPTLPPGDVTVYVREI